MIKRGLVLADAKYFAVSDVSKGFISLLYVRV